MVDSCSSYCVGFRYSGVLGGDRCVPILLVHERLHSLRLQSEAAAVYSVDRTFDFFGRVVSEVLKSVGGVTDMVSSSFKGPRRRLLVDVY